MHQELSQKELQSLETEFLYHDGNSGVIGGYCDSEFSVYYISKEMAELCGYDNVEEMSAAIDGKVANTIHPEDMPQVIKDLGTEYYEGMVYETTYRMPRKDGTWFWTIDKGKVIRTDEGKLAIISICSDMTKFVKKQKDLEKQNFITESMLKNLPGGYHRCSGEEGYPFLYISDRFLDILGWTAEEIRTKFDNKFINLVHPDDRVLTDRYVDTIVKTERGGRYQDQIYRLQGKDGYRWVTDSTIQMETGDETFFQGFISDITQFIEQIEEKELLEEEKEQAMAANEQKSRFLSSLSHDIRTPVNGIQGMLKIADTYPNDMKKQGECREKMWVATNYLTSLVNNVLNMNRLENKSIDLTEKPFNLIQLLMDITAMTDMQANAQGLHSIVDWKPGYITHRYLLGSAEGISRILLNLNSNAIKYNKKNGTLYCRCMEKEQVGDKIWFEFVTEDTGIGMDEEFLKHAFEPYAQKNNTSLNSINGVGLGLAIVKQTVELMGGMLKVESKLGEGTRYTIMLPFKVDENPETEPKPVEHLSLEGVKALLVEDNDLNMEIAKFHLEQEKAKVFTAVNGQEAVEMFEKSEVGFYDIVLMDIMMPIMNGLDATRKIRSLNRADAKAVPIIAMSANAFDEDIQKSLDAGMNEHLTKPLDVKKVTDTMKRFLANKIH